jgi:hypothetical protein
MHVPARDLTKDTMMDLYRHTIEDVPVPWLQQLYGNRLRESPEWVRDLGRRIEAEGMNNPLIITAGKETGTAMLGEGNHRLAALSELGYTHIPTRVEVGRRWGSGMLPRTSVEGDLIPRAGEYFPSEASPSQVFMSLRDWRPM